MLILTKAEIAGATSIEELREEIAAYQALLNQVSQRCVCNTKHTILDGCHAGC